MEMPTDLFDYLARPDSSYSWRILSTDQITGDDGGDGFVAHILLTSQTWQGIAWNHRLVLSIPNDRVAEDYGVLVIGADFGAIRSPERFEDAFGRNSGLITAHLYDVPNQPLFGDLVEDELIAHTFVQRLDTGDAAWPLLYPMTRSAIRSMDAVREVCGALDIVAPRRFIVTGASKRGWTTWLTAAADERVAAIIPVVYDNLNLLAQLPHQMEVWSGYSEQISDYTRVRLPERMATPEGVHLALSVDPFTYRDRIRVPKLIVNGTNDRYWATDALNLYCDALEGPRYLLYAPNHGHGAGASDRCAATALAFMQAVTREAELPSLDFNFSIGPMVVEVAARSTYSMAASSAAVHSAIESLMEGPADTFADRAVKCVMWSASSDTKDFRDSEWLPVDLERSIDGQFRGSMLRPRSRYGAMFAEITFSGAPPDAPSFTLSSKMRIFDAVP